MGLTGPRLQGPPGGPTSGPLCVQSVRIYLALASVRPQRLFPKDYPKFKGWIEDQW